MPELPRSSAERLPALIESQVHFGCAYIEEARSAYGEGRYEYGDLARQIAFNAYSTADRFAGSLPRQDHPELRRDLAEFKTQLDRLLAARVEIPPIVA